MRERTFVCFSTKNGDEWIDTDTIVGWGSAAVKDGIPRGSVIRCHDYTVVVEEGTSEIANLLIEAGK